ncbi:MAG: hypothetical protein NTV61_10970 [Candidatus Bathyarchaeota archaeon]|nr:hypothetical protein [Candidatus Bathyarchaeota archaeon]
MDGKVIEEARAEGQTGDSQVHPVQRRLTDEEKRLSLQILSRIARSAKERRVDSDSALLIRGERDR